MLGSVRSALLPKHKNTAWLTNHFPTCCFVSPPLPRDAPRSSRWKSPCIAERPDRAASCSRSTAWTCTKNKKNSKPKEREERVHAHVCARDGRSLREDEHSQGLAGQAAAQHAAHGGEGRIVPAGDEAAVHKELQLALAAEEREMRDERAKRCEVGLYLRIVCVKLILENCRMVMSRSPSLDSTHLYSGMRSYPNSNQHMCVCVCVCVCLFTWYCESLIACVTPSRSSHTAMARS
jgi:hypothetical protein